MKFKKEKVKLIFYWIMTVWGAFGISFGGICQLIEHQQTLATFSHLGYPAYFAKITGVWKVLAAIAILIPRYPVLKEWAYAGMFFLLTGAAISHVFAGDPFFDMQFAIFPSLFMLAIVTASYVLRPDDRRLPGTKFWKKFI